MTLVLCDASVVIKWQHEQGESEVKESRALLQSHCRGEVELYLLDLTIYEVGNVLVRPLGWDAARVADALEDLVALVPAISPTDGERRRAAELAEQHSLSYYDAAYAAVATVRGGRLVTADVKLLVAGLGLSPVALVAELGLPSHPSA